MPTIYKSVPCKEFMPDEVFECDRVCKKVKSCGLHKCQKKCCQEDQHICMQICDKMLNCGKHRCERLCHPGQCSPCTHASFDEEFYQLAECTYPCRREHACNHEVTHNCHREENCPPCMVLTSKMCAGGHETRKNIPCHLETISCGRPCGKALRCGIHECDKRCHRGECEKDDEICPASDCKEKMTVLCECGRRKEALRCVDVLKNVERLRAIRAEEEENRNATAAGPIKILRRSASMDRLNRCLPCDSECNRVARIKSMAEALDIQVDDNGDQLQCAPITYSEYLRYVMKNQADFLMLIEKAFVDLVRRDLGDNGICHNFKPMRIEARRAVHEYAVYFGLSSESVDSGAQRSVVVTGKKCSARIPTVTLSAYAARFPKKLLQTGPINISSECVNAMINVKAPTLTSEEPQMKPLETKLKAVRRRPPPTLQTTVVPISIANAFSALAEEDEEQHEKKTSTFDPFADEPIAKSHESEKGAFTPESSLVCTESFGAPNAPDSWEDGEQEVSSDVEQKVPPDASLE
ncbi:unnamed protein product, partial [Mesorhabditis belari]|uniref:R3H domain-containing protein n=1 Tax=Mesorhabditis belari TaxID=2138241 RepID=A0AAF3F719_9BILA